MNASGPSASCISTDQSSLARFPKLLFPPWSFREDTSARHLKVEDIIYLVDAQDSLTVLTPFGVKTTEHVDRHRIELRVFQTRYDRFLFITCYCIQVTERAHSIPHRHTVRTDVGRRMMYRMQIIQEDDVQDDVNKDDVQEANYTGG